MKLDFSKFKKIGDTDTHSTLRHEEGHEIKIAKSALSPKLRGQLHAIPMAKVEQPRVKLAEGTDEPLKAEAVDPNSQEAQPDQSAQQTMPNPAPSADQNAQTPAPSVVVNAGQAQPGQVPPAAQPPQASPDVQAAAKDIAQGAAQQAIQQDPSDPYGNEAYNTAYMKGLNEQKQGIALEQVGATDLGKKQLIASTATVKALQENQQDYKTHYDNLEKERQDFVQDIKDQHIDPSHYMGAMDTGQKISTTIGLVLGGLGSGIAGGPNQALDFLNRQIDRDIDAQRANLGKKESLLAANMRQFGNLNDATAMTRVNLNDIMANQFRQAAASVAGTMAQGRAMQMVGQLDAQSAPVISQIAMKRSLLGGGQGATGAGIPPESKIRALIPQGPEQDKYMKELDTTQHTIQTSNNLLDTFDKAAKLQTVASRLSSPIQSKHQLEALVDPTISGLSKETAGRYTEADARTIAPLMPQVTDSAQTLAIKRAKLQQMSTEKLQSNMLKSIGIDPEHLAQASAPKAPAEVKTMNGIKYEKVAGGWKRVQ